MLSELLQLLPLFSALSPCPHQKSPLDRVAFCHRLNSLTAHSLPLACHTGFHPFHTPETAWQFQQFSMWLGNLFLISLDLSVTFNILIKTNNDNKNYLIFRDTILPWFSSHVLLSGFCFVQPPKAQNSVTSLLHQRLLPR